MLHAELIGVETPTWKLEEPSLQEPHAPPYYFVHITKGNSHTAAVHPSRIKFQKGYVYVQ